MDKSEEFFQALEPTIVFPCDTDVCAGMAQRHRLGKELEPIGNMHYQHTICLNCGCDTMHTSGWIFMWKD
jgi:hypothetical protein